MGPGVVTGVGLGIARTANAIKVGTIGASNYYLQNASQINQASVDYVMGWAEPSPPSSPVAWAGKFSGDLINLSD